MRLLAPSIALVTVAVAPAIAQASPFAIALTAADLREDEPASGSLDAPAVGEPTDTAAPAVEPAEEPPAPEVEPAPEETPEEGPAAEGEEETDPTVGDPTDIDNAEEDALEDELSQKQAKSGYNANAIGVNGGIHLIPSYFLNQALSSYGNAMCRSEVGNWGEDNGLNRVDGCNFYINGGYTRRISRAFDISTNVGYMHVQAPDSLWLDNAEWDRDSCTEDTGPLSTCNLGAADYTRIDLRMVSIEVNFTGRGTLYRNDDVEVQLGGGGGIGVGILVGDGVIRVPLGIQPGSPDDPDSCRTLDDLGDFRKCTPRYFDDIDLDQDGDGFVMDVSREELDMGAEAPAGTISTGTSFAACTRDKCDLGDLQAFGATETGGTWPAYPIINIFGSFRIIIKDTFGLTIDGGIKDGFFFGGGMSYFFGGGGKEK